MFVPPLFYGNKLEYSFAPTFSIKLYITDSTNTGFSFLFAFESTCLFQDP